MAEDALLLVGLTVLYFKKSLLKSQNRELVSKNSFKGEKMNKRIDEVTGNDYMKEKEMYIRFHGLTEDEADLVMEARTYIERDTVFSDIIQKRWDWMKSQGLIKEIL